MPFYTLKDFKNPLILFAAASALLFALPFVKFVTFSCDMLSSATPVFQTIQDPRIVQALWNSVMMGAGTTVLGGSIGLILALFVGLSDTHRISMWSFLIFLILFLPPSFLAIAWIDTGILINHWLGMDNPMYTKTATVILLSVHLFPIAFFMILDQLKRIPQTLIDAGKITRASQTQLLKTIIIPILRPTIVKACMMLWVGCLGHFTLFALLGIPGQFSTLTTIIYAKLTAFGVRKMDILALLCVMLLLVGGGGLFVLRLFQGRNHPYRTTPKILSSNTFKSKRTRMAIYTLLAMICLSILLPMIKLVMTSLTPKSQMHFDIHHISFENYAYILTYPTSARAFMHSLFLALTVSFCLFFQSAFLEYGALLTHHPIFKKVRFFFQVFYLIPGSILGIGLILLFLNPFNWLSVLKLQSLYSSLFMIFVAYIIRFCAFHLNIIHAGRERFSKKWIEAARMCGASGSTLFSRIFLPLMLPSLLNGSFLVFILIMHEVTISALIPSSDTQTIGVLLLSMMEHGDTKGTAALCILVTLFLIVFRILTHAVTQRALRKVYH